MRVSVALAVLLGASGAQAQVPSARALIDQGRALRRAGRDADAYSRFVEAWRLAPSAEAAGQLGFAEHALGRWADADTHLRQALAATGDPWVVANQRALAFSEGEVSRHVGSLSVRCDIAGATLDLDGRRVGDLHAPAVVRVSAGPVALRIEAAGHQPDLRTLTVAAGETVETVCRLDPIAVAAPLGVPVVRGTEVVLRRVVEPVAPAPPPSQGGARRTGHATLGWITLGASLAAGVASGGLWYLRDSAAGRWNDDGRCLAGGLSRAQNCASDRGDVDQWHSVMLGTLVAAGALAVGSVVLLATSGSSRSPQRAWVCAPGLNGLGCLVRF